MEIKDITIRANPNGTFTFLYKGIARKTCENRVEAAWNAQVFIWTNGGKHPL